MENADSTDSIQTESVQNNEIVQTEKSSRTDENGSKKGYYTNKVNSVKKVVSGSKGKAGGKVSECQPDVIIEEIGECDPTVRRRTQPFPPITPARS